MLNYEEMRPVCISSKAEEEEENDKDDDEHEGASSYSK
jgi:hypothetical protein